MNGNKNIINVVSDLVAKMTPFVNISSVEADGSDWKLNTTNTYWITPNSSVIIDSVEYVVKDFAQNEYITIASTIEPIVESFQLEAPEFWHSSSRKVSNERSHKQDIRKPFVYLPVPKVDEDKDYDSSISYNATIKPIFLTNFDPQSDTIDLQQEEIINPLNAMASFFIYLIENDLSNFDDLSTITSKEWMNFGDETVWGNDKKIFNENLSGVELNFTLPVFDIGYQSCTPAVDICAPVTVLLNGEVYEVVKSGGTVDINTDCEDSTVTVNGDEFGTAASGETLDVPVKYENGTAIGTIVDGEVIIPDPTEQTRIYNPPAYSDAIDRDQDYDTYWRMNNNIGNYTQPMMGVAMRLAWGKYYLLHEAITIGNVFGNSQRWTGLTGGYFDWDTWYSSGKVTENYYDVDDELTTRELAFPDGLAVDHWIGALIQIDVPNTLRTVEAHRNYGATLTIAGYTGFYLLSVPETATYGTWGDITLPYTSSPLFDWNSGLKVTGDSYPVSPENNAMNAQAYGHFTSVPKANSNKAVFIKPFNPNTLL